MNVPGEPVIRLNFTRPREALSLISGEKARKLLWKGMTGFLAYVVNQQVDKVRIEQVLVVREFSDVFPEKLTALPPEREIEFGIDLILGETPISKTPYHMAPTEMKELKEQL